MPKKVQTPRDVLDDPKYTEAARNLMENSGKPGPKGGRPTDYHLVLTQSLWDLRDENPDKVWTQAEICRFLDISETTCRSWKRKYSEFAEVVDSHRLGNKVFYEKALRHSAATGKGNSRSIQFGLMNSYEEDYRNRNSDESIVDQKVNTSDAPDVSFLSLDRKRKMLALINSGEPHEPADDA